MSTNTEILNLFKYDPVADANNTFNITNALNDNWDKLDSNFNSLNEAKANIDLSNLSSTGNAKFNNKANTSLDNITSAGANVILNTGYTKRVNQSVFSGTGLTSKTTFTLNFLPDDGGVYEVFISGGFSCNSNNVSSLNCGSDLQDSTGICATNNSFTTQGNALVVTNNRKIWLQNIQYAGGVVNQSVSCLWYRRIGFKL